MAVARRPWRYAVGEVLLLCGISIAGTVMMGAVVMQFARSTLDGDIGTVAEVVSSLGSTVRGELGNGLAVAASIQFGVLIALVGRQIDVGSAKDEMSLREALNYLAELPVVLLAPAVLLATGGVIAEGGEGLGALLVIIPVFAVQVGMAVVTATFELADASTLVDRSEEWASRAVKDLRMMHRLPAVQRSRFAMWLAVISGVVTAIAVVPLAIWRPEWHRGTFTVLLLVVLLAVVAASALLMIAAENSSLKPRKMWTVLIPIRLLYVAMGSTLASIGLFGLFFYPPLGLAALFALILAVCLAVQSQREAKAVRANEQFDGYHWSRGGFITRFGNRWAASSALASLRSARAQAERHRSADVPIFYR